MSIGSGAVGLVAGVAAFFLKARVQALPAPASSSVPAARLASYRDESALAKPRQPKHLRRFLIVGGARSYFRQCSSCREATPRASSGLPVP